MRLQPRRPISLLLLGIAVVSLCAQASRGIPLFDAGDWAGARAAFSETIQRNDRDARAHYYLGRLALLDDAPDAEAAQFERAPGLDHPVADYHPWYGTAVSQQAGRASTLERPFMGKRALAEFERAVALDPRSIEALDSLVDFYSMAPAFMSGGTEKAREQAQALVRLDAARGHLAFARLATAAIDSPTAAREMQAAIASAPDTFRPCSALAIWYAKDKRWPEAFAALEHYIKKHPDDPYGPYGIGRIAALSGQQFDRGETGIRTFIAKPPNVLRLAGRVTARDPVDFNSIGMVFYQANSTDHVRFFGTVSRGGDFTVDVRFTESQRGRYSAGVYLFWPSSGAQYARTSLSTFVVQ